MFHADHSAVEVVAYLLVAALFLAAFYANATSRHLTQIHVDHFAGLGLPFARAILYVGYAMQLCGGLMVGLDWHAPVGAAILIVFTVTAMAAFHHFWLMEDGTRRTHARLFFINNCGVLGGLALIAEPAILGL